MCFHSCDEGVWFSVHFQEFHVFLVIFLYISFRIKLKKQTVVFNPIDQTRPWINSKY